MSSAEFESPIFGPQSRALPVGLAEAQIFWRLDLASLAACRLVNNRWRAAVDEGLGRLWSGLNRRLGIAEACEVGWERWRAARMLGGDCWVTCNFCPIVGYSAGHLESGLVMSSVKLDHWNPVLHVTAFSPSAAAFYTWQLQLRLRGACGDPVQLDRGFFSKSLYFLPDDWTAILHVGKQPAAAAACGGGSTVDIEQLFEYLHSSDAALNRSNHYPDGGGAAGSGPSSLVAIVPIPRSHLAVASPLGFVDLPREERVHRCLRRRCPDCPGDRLVLFTNRRILLFSLPDRPVTEATAPPILSEPDSVHRLPRDSQYERDLLVLAVQSCGIGGCGGGRSEVFLVYLESVSMLDEVLRVDQVMLSCCCCGGGGGGGGGGGSLRHLRSDNLAGCGRMLFTLDSDQVPVFLFCVGRESRLQLARCRRTNPDAEDRPMELFRDPCDYENRFKSIYRGDSLQLEADGLSVGRLFWCCHGVCRVDDRRMVAVYRVGFPEALILVGLADFIPELLLDAVSLRDFGAVAWQATNWIDEGFRPDRPDGTAMMAVYSAENVHLLLTWHCCHPRPGFDALKSPARLSVSYCSFI